MRHRDTQRTDVTREVHVGALERAAATFARIGAAARGLLAAAFILGWTVAAISSPAHARTHSAASLVGIPGGRVDELAAFSRASDCGSDLLASAEPAPFTRPHAAPAERTYFATCCARQVSERPGDAPHTCAPRADVHDAGDGKRAYRLDDGSVFFADSLEPFRYAGPGFAPAPISAIDDSNIATRIAAAVVALTVLALVACVVIRSRRVSTGVAR